MSRGSFNRPEVAAEYARARVFATGDDLAWLTEAAALTGQERVLDLGTAAGHTALALAPKSALTVGLDPAPAMLRQARRLARERRIGNLELVASFADPLPFADEVFDLVTCRLAAHHFPDLAGGTLRGRARPAPRRAPDRHRRHRARKTTRSMNSSTRSRRVRDPSHAHDYRLSEWADALRRFGMRYELLRQWELPLDFASWIARVGTPPTAIARLERLFDSATPAAIADVPYRPAASARTFCLHAALFVGTKS